MSGPAHKQESGGRDGFIVVAALWMLAALATLAAIYAVYVMDAAAASTVNDERMKAEALHTASIELAAYRMSAQPAPTGGRFTFRLGDATVSVEFHGENARIDLNNAPKALIAGLFTGLGAPAGLAETYAERVIAWRTPPSQASNVEAEYRVAGIPYPPRGGPFPHAGELALVAGIPDALVDRALPFVTVYSNTPQINVMEAAPEVIAALPGMTPERLHAVLAGREAGPQNAEGVAALLGPAQTLATLQGSKAIRVISRVAFDSGQRMSADIVIFLLDNGFEPYRVLSWRDRSDDPSLDERRARVR